VKNIKNFNKNMEYRRFGKTEEMVSVITQGGMRFPHCWDDPRDVIPEDTLAEAVGTFQLALDSGINLFETAYGYKKSENIFRRVLNEELKVPRDSYYLMTKGNPSGEETRELIKGQLKDLGEEYFDFYAWHGINDWSDYEKALGKGGSVYELLKLKEEGIIRHVGFSTHGDLDVIIKAIDSDLFDFVNLHYYYFFQRNKGAVQLASSKDMGVFIISPNDKGGQLFNPSPKLRELTQPLTPIQWNARFCLAHEEIHTLTFGMQIPPHYQEMKGIFPLGNLYSSEYQRILKRMEEQWYQEPRSFYEGWEFWPNEAKVNVPAYLRYWRMWKCFDLLDFGRYRYNDHSPDNAWVPGDLASKENLDKLDFSQAPDGIDLRAILEEAHQVFYRPKED